MRNHKILQRGISYMLMCVMIASNLAPALIAEAKPDPKATIFEEISAALTSQGIMNNLDSVEPSNAAAFSGLFFEKTGLGRITFPQPLNLHDNQTQTYLSNLGTALEMSQGKVGLDTSSSAAFAALGASIDIYGLPNIDLSKFSLSVKDSAGEALTGEEIDDLVSNESLDCSLGDAACVFSFDTEHFTTFEVDYDATAPIIAQVSPIATPTSDTSPSYVFDCDEVGAIVYGGSCGSADLARATVGSNTATFSLNSGTYADCTIKVVDDSGNTSNTLAVPSFTISEPAPSLTNIYEIAAGSNFDAAADSEGNAYAVYERSGNVYIAKNRSTETLVGAGSAPVIAIGSDNFPQVAYLSGGNVIWEKFDGDWEGETIVTGGSAVDIAVDSNNFPHLVFLKDTDSDWYGKLDVAYSYYDGTLFKLPTKIYDGYYWYENGGKSGAYFSYPHISQDANNNYHITTIQQSVSGAMGWSASSYSYQYISNIGVGISSGIDVGGSISPYSKNPIIVYGNGNAQIVYSWPGAILYKANASSSWSASSLGAGSSPAIASNGTRTAIAYSSSGVKYIEDNGSGFSAAADVDASGSNPTVVLAAGKRFVYYEKNGKVYLATDKTLYVNPVVSGVSDGGVYNTDKTVTWDSGTGTLDGASLSSGDTVSTEGAHVLVVSNENGSTTVNFTIDKTAPVITIAPYNGTTPTNQDITVTASTDEGNLNETSRTFTVNGSFAFIATDAAGNSATETVTITNIDKTAPTASVSYDITAPTNTDVIATMNPSEAVIVTSAGGSTHTFSENSSFTFEFRDDAGNTGSATASVSNIDRVAPIITVNPYNSTVVTNQDITVTVSTNEGTLNAASHTFSANGSFDFVAIDAAGNATTNTVTITNIDKVGPTITLGAYDGATPTNQDITVTASTDEGTLNAASHVFSANGSFDFVATDAAGNATTKTVTITNIDKTAPTASVSYDITTLTNLDVVATLHPSEEVTVTSGEGQLTHSFAANGDYNFTFTDAAGNAGSATASVNYIDKTAPIVTIAPYDGTTMTNQDITVNASTDEGTLNASSHTFSANGALSILSRLTRQETLRPERSPSPTSTRTPRQAAFPTT